MKFLTGRQLLHHAAYMPLTEIGSEDVETTINVVIVAYWFWWVGEQDLEGSGKYRNGGGVYIWAQLLQPTYIYL